MPRLALLTSPRARDECGHASSSSGSGTAAVGATVARLAKHASPSASVRRLASPLPGGSEVESWPLGRRAGDSEAMIEAVRHWALTLHAPRVEEEPKLVLPPLRPLKEYTAQAPLKGACSASFGQAAAAGYAGAAPWASSASFEASPGGSRSARGVNLGDFRSPKISQLGGAAPTSGGDPPAAVPSELAVAVARAKHALITASAATAARLRAQTMVEPHAELSPGARSAYMRTITVHRPSGGRPLVRGADPMGGGLFGRDARLDDVDQQRGIYEAQLVKKWPLGSPRLRTTLTTARPSPRTFGQLRADVNATA